MRGNPKGRYTFMILAGFYLLYLGWQLFNGFRSGEATNPIFLLAGVLFIITGVLIIVMNIRQIKKLSDVEASEAVETADSEVSEDMTESIEDTALQADSVSTANASLFDRAHLGTNEIPEEEE